MLTVIVIVLGTVYGMLRSTFDKDYMAINVVTGLAGVAMGLVLGVGVAAGINHLTPSAYEETMSWEVSTVDARSEWWCSGKGCGHKYEVVYYTFTGEGPKEVYAKYTTVIESDRKDIVLTRLEPTRFRPFAIDLGSSKYLLHVPQGTCEQLNCA